VQQVPVINDRARPEHAASWLQVGLAVALAAAAPAMLAATFLIGSIPDAEEFRFAMLASLLHVRALAEGTFASWTSVLGLGMPQPMVPNFNLHPLLPFLLVMSPGNWVRVFYVAHTIVGAVGMWQLGRALHLTPPTRGVAVLTFLLAAPTQNYALTDLWPSHYLVWMSAPWILLIAWRVLGSSERDVAFWSVMLGVCGGLVVANTNPGHVVVYGALIVCVAAARWRALVAHWRFALLAVSIAIAIASPSLLQLAMERAVFSENLGIVKTLDPLPPSVAWDVFLRPLSWSERPSQAAVLAQGTRTLFFGGPFAVLSLVGLLWFWRTHRDLVLGVALTSLLLFTTVVPITFASRFHFRDPLTLCAIALAALAADRLLRARRARLLAIGLLAAQVGVMAAGAWPFVSNAWQPDAREAMWFRGNTGETPLVDELIALMPNPGRLAYSPQLDFEISLHERIREGLGVNALAYRGVSVINGSFKGVSTDTIWQDDTLFYGRIRLPQPIVESGDALDVLGVRYLLAKRSEAVAQGLVARGSWPIADSAPLVLYENTDAWPGAFVMAFPESMPDLPRYPKCSNDRVLCRDLAPLARLRRDERVDINRQGARIDVGLVATNEPRLLVLAEMFRPEWTATTEGRLLSTTSVGPGLLGVVLPPATRSVRLDYGPTLVLAAHVVAWSAIAGGLIALFFSAKSRR
jgi:hypothetical protein